MRIVFVAGAMIWAGCTGEIVGANAGFGADASGPAALYFTAPLPASVHVRDGLDDVGALAALVDVEVEASGSIARIELLLDEAPVAEGATATVALRTSGAHVLRAVGYDGGGDEVATNEVLVQIDDPDVADCHGWLDLYQLDWAVAGDRQGVESPVDVTVPINGVSNRYVSNENPRGTFFMDCELALSLARAAPHMRERGVVELVDIGVYNYRCIGGGEPPDCPNGISQHAYAKAIDIAGFTTEDGEFYSVNDDWIIDGDEETTCGAAVEPGKDEWLHDIICAMKGDDVWNIVLTPNYNDAHRNHFHVDLTAGSDFIRRADRH